MFYDEDNCFYADELDTILDFNDGLDSEFDDLLEGMNLDIDEDAYVGEVGW